MIGNLSELCCMWFIDAKTRTKETHFGLKLYKKKILCFYQGSLNKSNYHLMNKSNYHLIIHLINKQASNAGFIEKKNIILGSNLRMGKGTRTKATISISFWKKNAFKLFLTSNIMREKQSKLQSLANLNILLQKKGIRQTLSSRYTKT